MKNKPGERKNTYTFIEKRRDWDKRKTNSLAGWISRGHEQKLKKQLGMEKV